MDDIKQLCRSEINDGDYDNIIKDQITNIVRAIMVTSKGKANPKQVFERIAMIAERESNGDSSRNQVQAPEKH